MKRLPICSSLETGIRIIYLELFLAFEISSLFLTCHNIWGFDSYLEKLLFFKRYSFDNTGLLFVR